MTERLGDVSGVTNWSASEHVLAGDHDVALCDLDGVIYVGRAAVPHAASTLAAVAGMGMRAGFVTNNASRPPLEVAAHLSQLGIPAAAVDVVTSAQAGARVLRELVPTGSRILFIGGEGVPVALRERDFVPVSDIADDPAALLQGYGRSVGWEQLAQGSYALFRGLPWVATNTDRTIPTPKGKALGNGAMVAALSYATGASPVVAGKPEPPLMLESVERLAARSPLVVGDRLDTDIEGANRSGIPAMLVLTGVTEWPDLLSAPPMLRPSYIAQDMRGLLVEHPEVVVTQTEDRLVAQCRGAVAQAAVQVQPGGAADAEATELDLAGLRAAGEGLDPGADRGLDAIRALAALAWAAADWHLCVTDLSVRAKRRLLR